MIRAICKQACIWQGRYWSEGKIYEGEKEPPKYFEKLEEREQSEKEEGLYHVSLVEMPEIKVKKKGEKKND